MDGLSCFWEYAGLAKKLLGGAKYNFYFDMLRELWEVSASICMESRSEYAKLRQTIEVKPIVVPVPLFWKRQKWRGFNQAEIISKSVAASWKLGVKNLLVRTRDTGRQVGRSREERLAAMKEAFKVKWSVANGQLPSTVLLVDDVWTTGATMNECAKVLKRAGVKRVWGLVLAR